MHTFLFVLGMVALAAWAAVGLISAVGVMAARHEESRRKPPEEK